MKYNLLCAALLVCVCGSAHAQEDLPNLDSLDAENYTVESDLMGFSSSGWFPRPFPGGSLSLGFVGGDTWDKAASIRSAAFSPTKFPMSHSNPYGNSSERRVKKRFSDEEEDDIPQTNMVEYTLNATFNMPLPCILRADAGLLIATSQLFSSDRTRSFLSDNGTPHGFHEVTSYHFVDYMLKGSIGVQVPVYGAFVQGEDIGMSSYYYVFGEYTALYSVDRLATQFAQIADAKDDLRYNNGLDTVVVHSTSDIAEMNTFRPSVVVGVGWSANAYVLCFTFEVFAGLPLRPVLRDADWKQYTGGISFTLGYQW